MIHAKMKVTTAPFLFNNLNFKEKIEITNPNRNPEIKLVSMHEDWFLKNDNNL
jgi:hypothetical protein